MPMGNATRSKGTLSVPMRPRTVLLQPQNRSAPPPFPQGSPRSFPATGDLQELQGAMAPSSPDAGVSCAGSDEGAQGPEEESAAWEDSGQYGEEAQTLRE
ncbi:hypothetical protein Celaphus_00010053 [Cervus elaphus hippelaphus]|uniref:Melanoma associated antigen N-terminal domain-containing protein n=1 Tax=Cervus elaphus hippelaphus TaxID=46360 RepID=A0A212BZI6_CEREH|nr:hypothetical protein Celaphus_00010053 [Cervus elaphus hippelaphus]